MLDWKRVSVLGLFLAAIVALAAIGRERLAELLAAGLLGSLAPGLIGTVKGTAERADKVLTVGLAAGLVAALAAMSCAAVPPRSSFPAAWGPAPSVCAAGPCYPVERCERVRAKYRAWGSVSYGAAAISGGGALTTAFPDSEDTRLGLGVTSAVVAIVAAVAVHLRDDYAAELSGFCPRGP